MLSLTGEPLTARRVWFTESHIVLAILFISHMLFIHVILDTINGVLYPVKQLDHVLGKLHSHFSVLQTTLARDCSLLQDCLCPLSASNHFPV